MTGKKFGRWTVIGMKGQKKGKITKWLCLCKCGTIRNVDGRNLRRGLSRSCGCLQKEIAGTKHGMSDTPEYITWRCMKDRCFNKSNPKYKYWGGRGITVCRRWLKFENFYKDMGKRPNGLIIERINNDKGYYKANCKWATYTEQNRNQQQHRKIGGG